MMSATDGDQRIEYPDSAGFLDEGTVAILDEETAHAVGEVDRPSADTESEIRFLHRSDEHVYAATIDDRQVASLRYDDVVAGRIIVLTTTVAPEFRGRGIAADLIADALDDIREQGLHVTVRCPVVAAFIAQNREYADLIASE
jgi:predicted GNAT family acetyltransferase